MAAKNADPLANPLSFEMGAQEWANSCGVCHVGGGQLEFDRDLQPYGSAGEGPGDLYVMKYARPDDPSTPIDETSWDNVTIGNMSATNKAEMDCLMCHLNQNNPGSSWMKTLDCGPSNPIGPMTDPTCSGTAMFPGTRTVSPDNVWAYDMYNRNFGIKQRRYDLIASMGAGAKGTFDADGHLSGVDWGAKLIAPTAGEQTLVGTDISRAQRDAINSCYDATTLKDANGNTIGYHLNSVSACVKIKDTNLAFTPKSESCAVCHARNDDTMGLPGMITMKTGFGNYGLIHDPSNPMHSGNMGASSDLNTDNGPGAVNDDYWFDFGCKTGMGKRAHKINAASDTVGPNARYGMSMFLPSTLDNDPATVPNAGDPIPGKMPDIDVHNTAGMQCADCHYAVGSTNANQYVDIPAKTAHGYSYPAERVYGMDHQFAQADSTPDTKSKNNLDDLVSCEGCHTVRDNPKLTENGGTLNAPTPLHNGLPQLHLDKIACVTCHIPETYSAPGRLKYRDWTAGFARGTFRNTLDWNYDLITGSHKTVPTIHKWINKFGQTKIYPALTSLLPTWYEAVPNSGVLRQDDAGMQAAGEPTDNIMDLSNGTATFKSPLMNRDVQKVAEYVRDHNPGFDMRLNGGNTVPLFDGFQIVDSWEIDTEAEINAMIAGFNSHANGSEVTPSHSKFLNVIHTDFDVTHGVVPKAWALGGSARGGCVSCHSSMNAASPNYSPYSVGFFEGYVQPVANAGMPGFGVGGYEMVKNWMAMFADFDAAAMCGAGDATKMAVNPMNPAAPADHENYYFNPMTGKPSLNAECGQNSWFNNNAQMGITGTAHLSDVVGMMTRTFDQAMGFPAGSAMQMGMYDGVAGIQGFAVRELQTSGTLGCNPFAGPISFSPMAGQSVNNCMPNAPMFNGTCTGAAAPNPGTCTGGFRDGGACMNDADCSGAMTDTAEIAHNPYGLLLSRQEAISHFKIDLQQSYGNINDPSTTKVKWAVSGEQNPGNPTHVASWDQANYCYDYLGGPNPMMPAVVPCSSTAAARMDGKRHIATAMSANQFLGYTPQVLNMLMTPSTASSVKTYVVDASFSGLASTDHNLTVAYDASRATCYKKEEVKDPVTGQVNEVITQETCTYNWELPGAASVTGAGTSQVTAVYPTAGAYTATLTMTMADDPATLGDESTVSDTQSVSVNAVVVEPVAPTADFATSVSGKIVTLTASNLDANEAVAAYIYWGDQLRTTVTSNVAAALTTGKTHTYLRIGTYNIKVQLYNAAHQMSEYTMQVTVR